MTQIAPFDETTLRAISDILGDTAEGLSGREIHQLLEASGGAGDQSAGSSKRETLFAALKLRQQQDRTGNGVIAFILHAMNPVRYTRVPHLFEQRRFQLNKVLVFVGLALDAGGNLSAAQPAHNLGEAQERAGRLYKTLLTRQAHSDVLRFCRAELLQDNFFHAVFEATKSIADKIREKSGLTSDGAPLIDEAFVGKSPRLAFNSLQTETDRSEHTGLMNLFKGLFGTFRNTTAHAPKIKWAIDEQDALDMLTFVSYLHRRLDGCVRTDGVHPD